MSQNSKESKFSSLLSALPYSKDKDVFTYSMNFCKPATDTSSDSLRNKGSLLSDNSLCQNQGQDLTQDTEKDYIPNHSKTELPKVNLVPVCLTNKVQIYLLLRKINHEKNQIKRSLWTKMKY